MEPTVFESCETIQPIKAFLWIENGSDRLQWIWTSHGTSGTLKPPTQRIGNRQNRSGFDADGDSDPTDPVTRSIQPHCSPFDRIQLPMAVQLTESSNQSKIEPKSRTRALNYGAPVLHCLNVGIGYSPKCCTKPHET